MLGIVQKTTNRESELSMSLTDTLTTVQDQYLSLVKQTQGFTVDAVRTISSVIQPLVRDLPPLPFADQLPSFDGALEAGFDFVEKIVAIERDFAAELVAAAVSADTES
jgi:hypothetical protein